MSRPSLKRKIDVCYSPDSSTPPRPPSKKQHTVSAPSDSPTNPFGLKGNGSYRLPYPTRVSEHFILRFQLNAVGRNVHRVATVPADYTFWHLHKLTQFLFGWKVLESGKKKRTCRVIEHRFEVMKDVTMCVGAQRQGQIKTGRTWAMLAGFSPAKEKVLPKSVKGDYAWYQEESFRIENVWSKGPDASRAISYVYDWHGEEPQIIYITAVKSKQPRRRGESNNPFVLEGRGLPDDDDDDEDFALDLLQWNEPSAFEDFLEDDQDFNTENNMSLSSPDFSFRIEKSLTRINKMTQKELLEYKLEYNGSMSAKNAEEETHIVKEKEEEDELYFE